MNGTLARKLRVRGRVQGVSYRESMCKMATQLGCTGWVRNRADGSVEAHVQGDVAAVEDLLQWARLGPPTARVDDLTSEDADVDNALKKFERRETA
jgi:acylphosphatase